MELQNIFPTPLAIGQVPYKFRETIPLLESFDIKYQEDSVGAVYGERTRDSYILNSPKLKEFKTYLESEIQNFAINGLNLDSSDYIITQSWVSLKNPNQEHHIHNHPNSVISGVFYWEEVDGENPIINFHRTQITNTWTLRPKGLGTISHNNLKNPDFGDNVYIKMSPGSLVLFPSFLPHSVSLNESSKVRKSLAFNSVTSYGIGSEAELTELKL